MIEIDMVHRMELSKGCEKGAVERERGDLLWIIWCAEQHTKVLESSQVEPLRRVEYCRGDAFARRDIENAEDLRF